jgi:hypothetical protein
VEQVEGEGRGKGRRYILHGVLVREGHHRVVYRADLMGDGGFVKPVAVHLLPEAEGRAANKLQDELRRVGTIRHRAVVHVDGMLEIGGHPALVTELAGGVGLDHVVRNGRVPVGPALEIGAEVAAALHAVLQARSAEDERGVLHRDLRPACIRLTESGDVKVLDFGFGIAAATPRGTHGYQSPERLAGAADHPAADVYALGVIIWELLVGQRFGPTATDHDSHTRLLSARQADLRDSVGQSADKVWALLDRMLHWAAAARPSAREVERECSRLARELSTQRLRELCESVLPPLLVGSEEIDTGDAFAGLEVGIEDAGTPVMELARVDAPEIHDRAPTGATKAAAAALGGLLAASGVLVVVLGVALGGPSMSERLTPASWRLEGDVDAWLGSSEIRFGPGAVPAGTHVVWADFGDGPVPAGTAEVAPGASVTITCTETPEACAAK